MKRIAILQSNYIPWKGYFDIIASVDEFILYDDMQYTRNDWRNRNRIKTQQGLSWCTVPVRVSGRFPQRIRDAEVVGSIWANKHLKSFTQYYKQAPFFDEVFEWLLPLYQEREYRYLSELNRTLIEAVCAYLDIRTKVTNSWDYTLAGDKTERLVGICAQSGAGEYISGPAAKSYMNECLLTDAGVKLTWFDYSGYPEYPQNWGDFVHEVSILDLLFNCGRGSAKYMKYGIDSRRLKTNNM